jgi:hypothetical protein
LTTTNESKPYAGVTEKDYSWCNGYLYSPERQADILSAYVRAFGPSGQTRSSICAALQNIDPDGRTQTIDDCQAVVVWLGNLRATLWFYQLMVRTRQMKANAKSECPVQPCIVLDGTAFDYGAKPGVYVVSGLNLLNGWEPESGSSVSLARQATMAKCQNGEECFLASIEALALYAAADPKLYQAQDGETLPFYDLAGIASGDGFSKSPYSSWSDEFREVFFDWHSVDGVESAFAQPSFRKVTLVG